MSNFNKYKKLFKSTITSITDKEKNYELAEAAFPAYANKNKLIDYLFWKRLEIPFNYITSANTKFDILDFGFGSGVMAYMLATEGHNVVGVDKELRPFNQIKKQIDFPERFTYYESSEENLKIINSKKYDFIVALDVLEHIEDLESIVEMFAKILKPDGKVIVSGPTENIFYKVGRKLAGKEYTGDYHVTDIGKIRAVFNKKGKTNTLKKLLFPVILFEIFIFKK